MTIIHPQNYKKNSSQQKKLLSGCNPILNSEPMMLKLQEYAETTVGPRQNGFEVRKVACLS